MSMQEGAYNACDLDMLRDQQSRCPPMGRMTVTWHRVQAQMKWDTGHVAAPPVLPVQEIMNRLCAGWSTAEVCRNSATTVTLGDTAAVMRGPGSAPREPMMVSKWAPTSTALGDPTSWGCTVSTTLDRFWYALPITLSKKSMCSAPLTDCSSTCKQPSNPSSSPSSHNMLALHKRILRGHAPEKMTPGTFMSPKRILYGQVRYFCYSNLSLEVWREAPGRQRQHTTVLSPDAVPPGIVMRSLCSEALLQLAAKVCDRTPL